MGDSAMLFPLSAASAAAAAVSAAAGAAAVFVFRFSRNNQAKDPVHVVHHRLEILPVILQRPDHFIFVHPVLRFFHFPAGFRQFFRVHVGGGQDRFHPVPFFDHIPEGLCRVRIPFHVVLLLLHLPVCFAFQDGFSQLLGFHHHVSHAFPPGILSPAKVLFFRFVILHFMICPMSCSVPSTVTETAWRPFPDTARRLRRLSPSTRISSSCPIKRFSVSCWSCSCREISRWILSVDTSSGMIPSISAAFVPVRGL